MRKLNKLRKKRQKTEYHELPQSLFGDCHLNLQEEFIRSCVSEIIEEEFAVKSNWFKYWIDNYFNRQFQNPESLIPIQQQFHLHHPEEVYQLSAKNKSILIFGSLERALSEFKKTL